MGGFGVIGGLFAAAVWEPRGDERDGRLVRSGRAALCRIASLGDADKTMLAGLVPESAADAGAPYEGYAVLVDLKTSERRAGVQCEAYGTVRRWSGMTDYQAAMAKRLGVAGELSQCDDIYRTDAVLRKAQRDVDAAETEPRESAEG